MSMRFDDSGYGKREPYHIVCQPFVDPLDRNPFKLATIGGPENNRIDSHDSRPPSNPNGCSQNLSVRARGQEGRLLGI